MKSAPIVGNGAITFSYFPKLYYIIKTLDAADRSQTQILSVKEGQLSFQWTL